MLSLKTAPRAQKKGAPNTIAAGKAKRNYQHPTSGLWCFFAHLARAQAVCRHHGRTLQARKS
jgi:hypothetical protein